LFRSTKFLQTTDTRETTEELQTLMDFLLLLGNQIKKSQSQRNLGERWILFRVVCLKKGFHFFDNIMDRQQRSAVDNLAPVQDVFDKFVLNCHKNYSLGSMITTDEQLLASEDDADSACVYNKKKVWV
jgi:hypothetical protein